MAKTATRRKRAKRAVRKSKQYVYSFAQGAGEGDRTQAALLGGKGANLAEMCNLGLPVPPGFTISTDVCTAFHTRGGAYPRSLAKEVNAALAKLEKRMGKRFGDPDNPLLVSVRSGASVSMPGMMDTVLNLGLNDETAEALAERTGNPRFAWDAYRRFIQMYGDVVLGIGPAPGEEVDPFHAAIEKLRKRRRIKRFTEFDAEDLRGLASEFKCIIRNRTDGSFPEDPRDQLWGAIGAVFGSWNNERAIAYRKINRIPNNGGTAVNVQAMVFGNLGETSGTGVAFTRDPASGEKRFYGEYLMNAQGEDVVAGIRTPHPIDDLKKNAPKSYRELLRIQKLLEKHFRDMQDLEFTIEEGKLYMLQCRNGKRTGFAAVRIAVDMVRERLITKEEALLRVDPEALNQLLQPIFKAGDKKRARAEGRVLTKGLNAGPGAATGKIVLSASRAVEAGKRGESVLLVRVETSPEDIRGMQAAKGILTQRGGMTSHAALVARQMGKVCVAGAGEIHIDYDKRRMTIGGRVFREGEWLSLDGSTGEVIEGQLATQPSEIIQILFGRGRKKKPGPVYANYKRLLGWADEVRQLHVRTNADQPDQCRTAIAFGAEGIGLCRTEHMFFGEDKIRSMREVILAETYEDRVRGLKKLLPLQRRDFEGIFKAMGQRPVTIRTLDPPLHEFLPTGKKEIAALAREMGVSKRRLEDKIESLSEFNPMLGHRGCRLGITYPEITRMQARAIFEAACNVAKRTGKKPRVEVMIPLIGTARELELQRDDIQDVAERTLARKKVRIPYLIGTMIELPRAALMAREIAAHAQFFSFGTNDLTQTAYGISRDDAGKFIPAYIEHEIFSGDPFARLDREGVGRLMRIACTDGRATRPDIKVGICGEHGGDPSSIEFCHGLGLEYVSCSPYRVPIARLAAAQAALRG
jgi:pyruvate,orthophosphate dikinase